MTSVPRQTTRSPRVGPGANAAQQGAGQPGYSRAPLAGKLGVKPGQRLLLHRAPRGWRIPALPKGTTVVTDAARADVAVAFFSHASTFKAEAPALAEVVKPFGALWVAWPRRAGGHSSDLTENLLRESLLPLGVVDTKVAALDNDWSGLKFVWRKELRES